MPKARTRRSRKVGRGRILDWLKNAAAKVDGFLRKTKILSKISSNFVGNPYGLAAKTALTAIGYGKRRNLGRGLRRAGTGLSRSGNGRRM